jgi:PmbA protein
MELCVAAAEAAEGEEQVEAFAEERSTTSVDAHRGEVEGLTFAESRGSASGDLGRAARVRARGRSLGRRGPRGRGTRARERGRRVPRPFNALPAAEPVEALDGLFSESLAGMKTDEKVPIALEMERLATSSDPRVRKTESVRYGDAIGSVAIASNQGVRADYRANRLLVRRGHARRAGWRHANRLLVPDRALDRRAEARRGRGRGGRTRRADARGGQPETAKVPVVLDPVAASAFLGVLTDALSADAVQKQRSLFGPLVGEQVGSSGLTIVDDGRLLDGPSASPFDGEGVPTGRHELLTAGVLTGSCTTRTRRGGRHDLDRQRGPRLSLRRRRGDDEPVRRAGDRSLEQLLREAEGGVLVQDVSGVHSGANPVSGEFSVGATGLRIAGGAPASPSAR